MVRGPQYHTRRARWPIGGHRRPSWPFVAARQSTRWPRSLLASALSVPVPVPCSSCLRPRTHRLPLLAGLLACACRALPALVERRRASGRALRRRLEHDRRRARSSPCSSGARRAGRRPSRARSRAAGRSRSPEAAASSRSAAGGAHSGPTSASIRCPRWRATSTPRTRTRGARAARRRRATRGTPSSTRRTSPRGDNTISDRRDGPLRVHDQRGALHRRREARRDALACDRRRRAQRHRDRHAPSATVTAPTTPSAAPPASTAASTPTRPTAASPG